MHKITISYGYDIHSIEVDDDAFRRIQSGELLKIIGQGFVHEEDGEMEDEWIFNTKPGEIFFRLDNSAEYWAQKIWIDE